MKQRIYLESLNRAIQYTENNADKKILLKDIAREAFLSEFHFHRIFKSLTGENHEGIKRIRAITNQYFG